ncbi:hypothetical protein [Acetobacter thailandicus]|uniref:hypothetical protein n=1 Tax=Acetobacter thailandicus TaxID=1502842 RepID=UPI001BAE4ABB|nr:hypothetical protein [Acetobacter thailandicus]MBS0979305.1 hypothetical protein [Acetobacter thailandicus]
MSDLVVHCTNSDLNSIAMALQSAKIHLIDDTRHGRPWKEIFQGAVTLCVGLFAGWIAWQQKEIAKENKETTKQKLKLEIFEKRLEIVEIIENSFLSQIDDGLFKLPTEQKEFLNKYIHNKEYKNLKNENNLIKIYLEEPQSLIRNTTKMESKIPFLFSEKTSDKALNLIKSGRKLFNNKLNFIDKYESLIQKKTSFTIFKYKKEFDKLRQEVLENHKLLQESLRENEFKGLSDW